MRCTACQHVHDMDAHRESWEGGSREFGFDCEKCGTALLVSVDWNPTFYAMLDKRMHRPAPVNETPAVALGDTAGQ